MRRTRSTLLAVAFATAMLAPLLTASPASATPPLGDGCNLSATPGAEIGHFPSMPGSQSGLVVSCVFNNQPATNQVASAFTFSDFSNAQYHNGAARTVSSVGAIAIGATTFTIANCEGITGWVNNTITRSPFLTNALLAATGLTTGTFVKSISAGCLVTLSQPAIGAMSAGQVFRIDNFHARRMANTATACANVDFASGSTNILSAALNFTAADIGLSVTGTEIAPDTEITAVVAPNATINNATLAADTCATPFTTITLGASSNVTSTRHCRNATRTATVITSTTCKFTSTDVGLPVYDEDSAAGIPASRYITSVNALGTKATVAAGGMTLVTLPAVFDLIVGDPTVTAPNGVATGDEVATQGINLDLSPNLVAGSQACSAENPEGFGVVASWKNPGEFTGGAPFNSPPGDLATGYKVIGQIVFATSSVSFSIWVVETSNPLLPGDFTFSIVAPNAPTTLAMCVGTLTSPGLAYSLRVMAQTAGVAMLPPGTGRPGTAQVRALKPAATYGAGYTTSATLTSDTAGVVYSPLAQFTRLCNYPAGSATASFRCGNG